MWLLMRQGPLKHKECPLKRQVVGRVVHSSEIQVAERTALRRRVPLSAMPAGASPGA